MQFKSSEARQQLARGHEARGDEIGSQTSFSRFPAAVHDNISFSSPLLSSLKSFHMRMKKTDTLGWLSDSDSTHQAKCCNIEQETDPGSQFIYKTIKVGFRCTHYLLSLCLSFYSFSLLPPGWKFLIRDKKVWVGGNGGICVLHLPEKLRKAEEQVMRMTEKRRGDRSDLLHLLDWELAVFAVAVVAVDVTASSSGIVLGLPGPELQSQADGEHDDSTPCRHNLQQAKILEVEGEMNKVLLRFPCLNSEDDVQHSCLKQHFLNSSCFLIVSELPSKRLIELAVQSISLKMRWKIHISQHCNFEFNFRLQKVSSWSQWSWIDPFTLSSTISPMLNDELNPNGLQTHSKWEDQWVEMLRVRWKEAGCEGGRVTWFYEGRTSVVVTQVAFYSKLDTVTKNLQLMLLWVSSHPKRTTGSTRIRFRKYQLCNLHDKFILFDATRNKRRPNGDVGRDVQIGRELF